MKNYRQRPLYVLGWVSVLCALVLFVLFPVRADPGHRDNTRLTITGKVEDFGIEEFESLWGDGTCLRLLVRCRGESITAYCRRYDDDFVDKLKPGNTVTVKGTFHAYLPAENPGGFNKLDYFASKDRYGYLTADNVRITDISCWPFRTFLHSLRGRLSSALDSLYDGKDAGILKGILTGDSSEIPDDIRDLYRDSGLSHLLAISGLHTMILGMAVSKGVRKTFLPRTAGAAAACGVVFVYMLLCGCSVSMLRAFGMLVFYHIGEESGRAADSSSMLGFLCAVCLIARPYMIVTSGFQFSFLCLFLLTVFLPSVMDPGPLTAVLFHLGILPLTLYHFCAYPVYGILINLVLLPCFSVLFLSGLLSLSAVFFSRIIARVPASCCHHILAFYEWFCRFFQRIPGAVWIPGKPFLWQILIYGVLFISGCGFIRKRKGSFCIPAVLCLVLALRCFGIETAPASDVKITVLSVGQGDGICIRTESHHAVMIDGGSSQKNDLAGEVLIPFLRAESIGTVDTWFVTHADSDHTSGLMGVLEDDSGAGPAISRIVIPSAVLFDDAYEDLFRAAEKKKIPVCIMSAGDTVCYGGISFLCLHPEKGEEIRDHNEESLVILMSYGEFQMLFTGDLPEEEEERMIAALEELAPECGRIEILKVAHHGSKSSTSDEFLDAAEPAYAVISSGRNNIYGHPHPDLIARLDERDIPYWNTAETGAVIITTNGKRMAVRGYL